MSRAILQALNDYQKARLRFVQTISDVASRPGNIEALESAGVLDLLRPLLLDVEPSIQQTAVMSLGKLANHSESMARSIVQKDFMPQLLTNISKQNVRNARIVTAKHSEELATIVVRNGGLEVMVACLEDFDPGVKEAAAWAIGYVTRHNRILAMQAVDAGVLPLLILCLQEPELCLKQISASALCDISKHSAELGQAVTDAGAIPFLAQSIGNTDVKLKRQIFFALGSIAKHSVDLAESVVEADIFPEVLQHMAHPDEGVQKAAAILTREICKHSHELAELVVNTGGIAALIQLLNTKSSSSGTKLPAIMALGYIAGHSGQMAMVTLDSNGPDELAVILNEDSEDHMLAVSAWALGQMGKHSPDHAKAIASTNVLPRILQLYCSPKSSEDLKNKTKTTLKSILQQCTEVEILEPLLTVAPPEILKYILGQFAKVLPHDPKARRLFVTSGGLKKVQEIQAEPGTALSESITIINCCFPEEIVRYYSPGYPEILLDIVDKYEPKRFSALRIATSQSSEASHSSHSPNITTALNK